MGRERGGVGCCGFGVGGIEREVIMRMIVFLIVIGGGINVDGRNVGGVYGDSGC